MGQIPFHAQEAPKIRRIGQIPIRNIWLLMLYASNLYRHLDSAKIAVEDNPDEIADLVAEILCHQTEVRLVRNLSHGYTRTTTELNRVRGRINLLATERRHLLDKGKVSCSYDELTIDTPRNRYVLAALKRLPKLGICRSQQARCLKLAARMSGLGMSHEKPSNYRYHNERFGRHDVADQKMIAAAELAFTLALPNESTGHYHLNTPAAELGWLRKLFEKGIAGFYQTVLNHQQWRVQPGKCLNWDIWSQTEGIDAILPTMQTDIMIEHLTSRQRLVIDTKFNAVTVKGYMRDKTLRSHYLYQMYAYLRSQERPDDKQTLNAMGMLLHPSVDEELTEMVNIQGHPIWFCTINLGESAFSIRQRLLCLIEQCYGDNQFYSPRHFADIQIKAL